MGSAPCRGDMRMLGVAVVLLFFRFGPILCRPGGNACENPSGVSSSPSSCSSYLSCDQAGQVQEKECKEGMLWNEEEQYCDWHQNVSCWKDILWYLRTGLSLLSTAGRVTANLIEPANAENVDTRPASRLRQSFGSNRELISGDVNIMSREDGSIGPITGVGLDSVLVDEEGSGFLGTFEEGGGFAAMEEKVAFTDNVNKEDRGTTGEPKHYIKLSGAFKKLFLEENNEKQLDTVSQASDLPSSPPTNSLPWIVSNWVPE